MVIVVVDSGSLEASQSLAAKFGFSIVEERPTCDYYLAYENHVLCLKDRRQGDHFSISIDIANELDKLRRQRLGYNKDLLARAVGFRGQENYTVLDGTLGFAKDAIHLLSLGCQIRGCEKDPIIFSLLEDSILRWKGEGLQIEHNNIKKVLAASDFETPACLYLDPMFDPTSKKAKPKKYMTFLRDRGSDSGDFPAIISQAIVAGVKRVVVKRPLKGEQLYPDPSSCVRGKMVRFDIYRSENF